MKFIILFLLLTGCDSSNHWYAAGYSSGYQMGVADAVKALPPKLEWFTKEITDQCVKVMLRDYGCNTTKRVD